MLIELICLGEQLLKKVEAPAVDADRPHLRNFIYLEVDPSHPELLRNAHDRLEMVDWWCDHQELPRFCTFECR